MRSHFLPTPPWVMSLGDSANRKSRKNFSDPRSSISRSPMRLRSLHPNHRCTHSFVLRFRNRCRRDLHPIGLR